MGVGQRQATCTSVYELDHAGARRLWTTADASGGSTARSTVMQIEQVVEELGGVATRAALIALTSRAEVDRALREERLVRVTRGKYATPTLDEARRTAARLHAVVSHLTAAQAHGWELKRPPERPALIVPRGRNLRPEQCAGLDITSSQLGPRDVYDGWLTAPVRTFVDCSRTLPFDELLALADSALRSGRVTGAELVLAAETMRGTGAPLARRVARLATPKAANPFESVLRAIAEGVPGLAVEPQLTVVRQPFPITPDLVDRRLRLAIEADSFAWHGERVALRRDCRRYTTLAMQGWRLVRFAWEDVMHEPAYVRDCLVAMVALVDGHTRSAQARSRAA